MLEVKKTDLDFFDLKKCAFLCLCGKHIRYIPFFFCSTEMNTTTGRLFFTLSLVILAYFSSSVILNCYFCRPTKPVGWWEGSMILGGKDEVAGGTWLACSREGKVAFVTNVLELHTLPEAKSRGDLPIHFLEVPLFSNLI